jgi:hypothetical protein
VLRLEGEEGRELKVGHRITLLVPRAVCQVVVMARRREAVVAERRVLHDRMQPRMHFEQPVQLGTE